MVKNVKIFFGVYDVDWPCVEDSAVDRKGEDLLLIDGRPDPEVVRLKWPSSMSPPDFIYSLSGRLFVSPRTRQLWSLDRPAGHSLVPVELLGKRSRVLADGYSWVNLRQRASILDEARSECTKAGDFFLSIERFVVAWEQVPKLDLFLCDENAMPIFSEELVQAARGAGLTGIDFVEVEGGQWPL